MKPKLLIVAEAAYALCGPLIDEFEIVRYWEALSGNELLRSHGPGIRAILSFGTERIDATILDLLPDLELIACIGVGFDGIDTTAVRARGIAMTNAGALPAEDNADYAVGMMIAARRRIVEGHAWVRDDGWLRQGRLPLVRSLRHERVGIVGLGNIGRAVAARVAAFGMEVCWWGPRARASPHRRCESLIELASWSRILFVTVRAHENTRGLIDSRVIDALGPEGLLINITRGFVVDEKAVAAALRDGRLGQAALDVFDPEPTPGSLWANVPNILLSPHAAGGTLEGKDTLVAAAVNNLRRLFAGESLDNIVIAGDPSARLAKR